MKRTLREAIDNRLESVVYVERAHSRQRVGRGVRIALRPAALLAALCIVLSCAVTVFATSRAVNRDFYLRYLSPEEMAVADAAAQEYGPKVYFDGLKSEDVREQYFCINKLIPYANDEKVRQRAIKAIEPFLNSEEERLRGAAELAMSVLTRDYGHKDILRLADGRMLLTLFNGYSDYGTYPEIWMIDADQMSSFTAFRLPSMYITDMILSPGGTKLAVATCSNKSGYLTILDVAGGFISPELVDTARIAYAKEKGYAFLQRADYENYSGARDIEWADDDTLRFDASLAYGGGEIIREVSATYSFADKVLALR